MPRQGNTLEDRCKRNKIKLSELPQILQHNLQLKVFIDANFFIALLYDVKKHKISKSYAFFILLSRKNITWCTNIWVIQEVVWFIIRDYIKTHHNPTCDIPEFIKNKPDFIPKEQNLKKNLGKLEAAIKKLLKNESNWVTFSQQDLANSGRSLTDFFKYIVKYGMCPADSLHFVSISSTNAGVTSILTNDKDFANFHHNFTIIKYDPKKILQKKN